MKFNVHKIVVSCHDHAPTAFWDLFDWDKAPRLVKGPFMSPL
jgi:hypothetical protein